MHRFGFHDFLLAAIGWLILGSFAVFGQEIPVWNLPPKEEATFPLVANEIQAKSDVQDWGHSNLSIPASWKRTKGKDVVVAVLDTGVYRNHRDLKDQILSVKNYTTSPDGDDKNGHGTHCAGVILAAENQWGMIGVAPGSKLRVYKVLGDDGSGRVDWIAKAIRDAADDGCAVIAMSLGGPSADQWIPPALDYARSKGVIVIAAAGNEGPNANTVGFPGAYKQCLAVAAHDSADRVASFSSRGPAVFTSGPGVDVRAAYPGPGDGRFATMSGTSMATPYIAGVAALWASANKNLKKDAGRHDLFAQQLRAVCTRPDQRTTASGYGKPNVAKLLPELEEPNPPDNPTNPPVTPIAVTISEASLTPEELKKLKSAGIERFSFTINPAVIPKVATKQNRMELKFIPGIGWTLVPVE